MICERCGLELEVGDWPFCGKDNKHGRKGTFAYTNFRDEYPGGITLENYGAKPVTFYSESERRAYMAKQGLEQREKWAPFPGTDRDPMGVQDSRKYQDPYTLENGRILMLRAAGCKDDSVEGVIGGTYSGSLTERDAVAVSEGDKVRQARLGRRLRAKSHTG